MSEIKLYAKDWIPITQPPFDEGVYLIVHEPCQCISTARYWKSLGGAPKWTDNITGNKVFEPTHWTNLPTPPPREGSFEEFWRRNGSSVSMVGVDKELIRQVWDLAIAASKRPDFVP